VRRTGRGCLCDLAEGVIFGLGLAIGRALWRLIILAWGWPAPRIVIGGVLLAVSVPWEVASLSGASAVLAGALAALGLHGVAGGLSHLRPDWAASPVVRIGRAAGYALLLGPGVWAAGLLIGLPVWGAGAAVVVTVAGIAAVSLHGLGGSGGGYAPRLGEPRVRRLH
jgi:hypothetical protein